MYYYVIRNRPELRRPPAEQLMILSYKNPRSINSFISYNSRLLWKYRSKNVDNKYWCINEGYYNLSLSFYSFIIQSKIFFIHLVDHSRIESISTVVEF